MSDDAPNEARVRLHDAGWDYWFVRMTRASHAGVDDAEAQRRVVDLLPVMHREGALGAAPWPYVETTTTHVIDGNRMVTTYELFHFYDFNHDPTTTTSTG